MKQVWRPKLAASSKIAEEEEEEEDYYHDREKAGGYRRHRRKRNRRTSQQQQQEQLPDLPWEAICIIMSKLPIKSIFRFTSVSKSFNNFPQDPYFISLHSTHQPPNIIIFDYEQKKFKVLEKQPNDNHRWTSTIIPITREFEDGSLLGVVGTCNGLLCLSCSSHWSPTNLCIIYNPVTRHLKTISKPRDKNRSYNVYCFGFDSKSKAYKLIVICGDYEGLLVSNVTTLAAGVTSWRKLDLPAELNLKSIGHQKPVFFNGEVYSITTSYLLVIDISKETCRLIDTTEISPIIDIWSYNLYESGTHLTLLKFTEEEIRTWQLLDSHRGIFGQGKGHDRIFQDYKVKFAGTVGNDKLLLRKYNDPVPAETEGYYDDDGPYTLSAYDLKTGKLSRISRSIPNSCGALPFVASLAPLSF